MSPLLKSVMSLKVPSLIYLTESTVIAPLLVLNIPFVILPNKKALDSVMFFPRLNIVSLTPSPLSIFDLKIFQGKLIGLKFEIKH